MRAMNPQVIVKGKYESMVAHCVWRSRTPDGERHVAETLAAYVVRDGRVARARTFQSYLGGVIAFFGHPVTGRTTGSGG